MGKFFTVCSLQLIKLLSLPRDFFCKFYTMKPACPVWDFHCARISNLGTTALYCTVGWVNFSEFEIIVCGSCKM